MGNYNLFGFLFKDKKSQQEPSSFAPPANDDGALVLEHGGVNQQVVDLDGVVKNEIELITKYREMSQRAEVEGAISEIVNESIVPEEQTTPISLVTDKLNYSEDVVQKIQEEFDTIMNLLDFNNEGQDVFRRWYTDGRLVFHLIIDPNNPRNGIQELRYIDPRRIKPVIETESYVTQQGVPVQTEKQRYYVYNQFGTEAVTATVGVKIAWDSICYVHSGIQETNNTMILGHLHKALKPANMLTMVEDATVIYRLCLQGDSRVLTPSGYRYISELRAGDVVYALDEDGKQVVPTTILRQWSNGREEIYRVASKHHELFCTAFHPILVRDVRTGVQVYVNAKEILPKIHQFVHKHHCFAGSEIEFPKTNYTLKNKQSWSSSPIKGKESIIKNVSQKIGCATSKVRNFLYGSQSLPKPFAVALANNIPVALAFEEKIEGYTSNSLTLPKTVNEDFARLFGFLIGDGSVSDYRVSFAAGTDSVQNEKYATLMEDFFGHCKYYQTDRKYSNYTTSNTLAAELLREMGFMTGAKRKRIPQWVFQSGPSIRKAFIEGLCDAVGCIRITKKGTWFCTLELANKRLIEDVKEIWTSIGLSSGKIGTRTRKGHKLEGRMLPYSTTWNITLTKLPLSEFENIITVRKTDRIEEVFDIEVDDVSQNFIVNGILSHNSRAPERRVFYIDVGNLPKQKAEQYLKDIMSKYRNKMVYDACLAMNTKIPLLDGRTLTLKAISEEFAKGERLWAYSVNPTTGEMVPGLITSAGVTRKDQEVLKLTLDNGETVICTLDHSFPVWNKGKVQAKDLSVGDSLVPFYQRERSIHGGNGKSQYEQIYDNNDKCWKFTHRMVSDWKDQHGLINEMVHDEAYQDASKRTVHHRNYNRRDNSPENLARMKQTVSYPQSLIDVVQKCATDRLSANQAVTALNHEVTAINEWRHMNSGKVIRGKGPKTFDFVTKYDLRKMAATLGHSGFRSLKDANVFRNHKIVSIERLSERMDVGTLSIDREERYHNHHTFALASGVFTYNSTGEIREDKKFLSFMEDYWMPRREGGKGTEVTTLPGGENLGEMADVEYFKEKLYQSLNVPVSRLQSQATMSFGDGATITREEVKFGKFIYRLRNRFTQLFDVLLSTQLMLKGVIAKEDWMTIRQKIHYDFLKDTYYSEMKNQEVLRGRAGMVDTFLNYVGKYVSHEWVRRNLLKQTDEEMKELDTQMRKEKSDPRYQAIEAMTGMGMGGGMGMDGGMGGGMGGGGELPPGQEGEMGGGMPPEPEEGGGEYESPTDNITKNVSSLWQHP